MKHVHAEVIKAWADDTSVQIELDTGSGWRPATSRPTFWEHCNLRIKPQPKAIGWVNIYANGVPGFSFRDRQTADAELHANSARIAIVETRDDGTVHLHKVDS